MEEEKLTIFYGILKDDIQKMSVCFKAEYKKFSQGDIIADYNEKTDRLGIIQNGSAKLEKVDYSGNRTILEQLKENDLFGDVLNFTNTFNDNVQVICDSECNVMFFDYSHLIKRCEKACRFHSLLVENALRMLLGKSLRLSEKIDVLSHKSIRGKLMCFFSILANENKSKSFMLPFSLSELADYICADRSAMMREIKNMKEDGLVSIHGKKLTINN